MTQSLVVQNDSVIVRLMQAGTALTEAKTIQQTKKIVDIAAAAEIWARRQQLGDEAESLALSIKLDALRQLGSMLKETPKATGGDAQRTRFQKSTESPPTLADMGLDKKTSSIAQKLANLPEKDFEKVREGHETVAKALAAVKSTKPAKKPKPEPEPVEDHGDQNWQKEFERQAKEIDALESVIESLKKEDRAKEIIKWTEKYAKLEGRVQQLMTTEAEARKQAAYSTKLLAQIRKALKVERNGDILAKLK